MKTSPLVMLGTAWLFLEYGRDIPHIISLMIVLAILGAGIADFGTFK